MAQKLTSCPFMNNTRVVSLLIQSAYFTTVVAARMGSGVDREAKIELGAAVAARLKLTKDGSKVLWPQPTDSPKDPQNWTMRRKNLQLLIVTLAAIVPDFDSGIGK
jgi:hypothetical protein